METYSCEELRILARGAHIGWVCFFASRPMVPLHTHAACRRARTVSHPWLMS